MKVLLLHFIRNYSICKKNTFCKVHKHVAITFYVCKHYYLCHNNDSSKDKNKTGNG